MHFIFPLWLFIDVHWKEMQQFLYVGVCFLLLLHQHTIRIYLYGSQVALPYLDMWSLVIVFSGIVAEAVIFSSSVDVLVNEWSMDAGRVFSNMSTGCSRHIHICMSPRNVSPCCSYILQYKILCYSNRVYIEKLSNDSSKVLKTGKPHTVAFCTDPRLSKLNFAIIKYNHRNVSGHT